MNGQCLLMEKDRSIDSLKENDYIQLNQSRWGRRNPSAVFCMGPLNYDQNDCDHWLVTPIYSAKNIYLKIQLQDKKSEPFGAAQPLGSILHGPSQL